MQQSSNKVIHYCIVSFEKERKKTRSNLNVDEQGILNKYNASRQWNMGWSLKNNACLLNWTDVQDILFRDKLKSYLHNESWRLSTRIISKFLHGFYLFVDFVDFLIFFILSQKNNTSKLSKISDANKQKQRSSFSSALLASLGVNTHPLGRFLSKPFTL